MSKINFGLNDNIVSQFGLKRKRLATGYSTQADTIRSIRASRGSSASSGQLTDLTRFTEGSQLDDFFKQPSGDKTKVIAISNALYQTNPIYQKILDYFTTMYYWRYVTTPRIIKGKKPKKSEYKETYEDMLEIVDGISVETTFPRLMLTMLKNGRVFIYCEKDTPSKTVNTIILPNKYCRPALKTQYGTTQIEFNFKFFDEQGLDAEEKIQLLALFPDEFVQKYDEYRANQQRYWLPLNAKISTCISMNDAGFPSFLSIFYDIIDYKTYKMNELDRNTNKLERLVSQEIDLEKTQLELEEVEALHDSMADIICQNKGSTLVTSVGKIDVHQLGEDANADNEALDQAYNTIYSNAGINYNLFNGSIAESLDASLKRDLAFMWNYVEQLVAFYNVAINNLINFHDYQLSFRILPISSYNEKEKLEIYHTNAEYGIGLVDLMIASGIKQVDIESTLQMEEFLDLTNRLVPLQSSHTLSSSSVEEQAANDSKTGTAKKSTSSTESAKTTTSARAKQSDDSDKK